MVASDGERVRDGGEQCLGAGAEPLLPSRLLAGHQMCNRPSGICSRLTKEEMKEEILTNIAGDV